MEAALASEEMKRQNPPAVGELQQEGVEEEVGAQQAQEMECEEEGEGMAMNQESNEEHIYEEPPEVGPLNRIAYTRHGILLAKTAGL